MLNTIGLNRMVGLWILTSAYSVSGGWLEEVKPPCAETGTFKKDIKAPFILSSVLHKKAMLICERVAEITFVKFAKGSGGSLISCDYRDGGGISWTIIETSNYVGL